MSRQAIIVSGMLHGAAITAVAAYVLSPAHTGELPNFVQVELVSPVLQQSSIAPSVQKDVSPPVARPLAEVMPAPLDLSAPSALPDEIAIDTPSLDPEPGPVDEPSPPAMADHTAEVTEPVSETDQALRERLEDRVAVRRQGPKLILDVLGDVLFELDSAELRPRARLIIKSVAEELRHYSSTIVNVNGFTDTSGSSAHNLQLSLERAKTVARELTHDGVDPRRIHAEGYGPKGLAVPTAEGVREARNRRVEVVLQDINGLSAD